MSPLATRMYSTRSLGGQKATLEDVLAAITGEESDLQASKLSISGSLRAAIRGRFRIIPLCR